MDVFDSNLFQNDNQLIFFLFSEKIIPRLETHVPVYIKVKDINDNAPEFAFPYDPRVCENAAPGQVKFQKNMFLLTFSILQLIKEPTGSSVSLLKKQT